jgi:hypothetical protein
LSGVDYDLVIDLIDKTVVTPVTVLQSLKPHFGRLEATHTGVAKTNNAKLTLVIPPDGQFVRIAPILTDEFAKVNYLIGIRIDQGVNIGQEFRCEIGQPTIREDENLGEVLDIPLVAIEFRIKENYSSQHDVLSPPKTHFVNLVTEFNNNQALNGTLMTFVGGTPAAIDLPDEPVLKQDWTPLAPETFGMRWEEIINRLAEAPQIGGTLRDFYYDFVPDALVTRLTRVFAEEFGLVDSGVVINPLTLGGVGSEEGKDTNTDNLIFKNLVVLKNSTNDGTLPTNLQRFRSNYLGGINLDSWDNTLTYNQGDRVKVILNNGGVNPDILFFEALSFVPAGTDPQSNPLFWKEYFTTDPTDVVVPFFTNTPWTNSLDDWIANMAGTALGGGTPPGGFAGFMTDFNVTRTLFDRPNSQNRFARISVKMIDQRSNAPIPVGSRYDGQRVIVGIAGSVDGDVTSWNAEAVKSQIGGDQTGLSGTLRGRIAEFVSSESVWVFSELPIDNTPTTPRQQDSVNNMKEGEILKWDATANGAVGDWVVDWNIASSPTDANKSSPFHPVQNLGIVQGATGINSQAIEATYYFKRLGPQPPFEDNSAPNGAPENVASRGAWLSFWFPFPRIPTPHGGIGHEFGDDLNFPYLDTFNLTRTCSGKVGWNFGQESEDLGTISAIRFKLKLEIYQSGDDSKLAFGYANMPMVFWAVDKFDRIYFQDFEHEKNGSWQDHTIPVGPRSPQAIHNSRIDELYREPIFGHILPNFDFFLKEREFTGIEFDWRFLKGWGVFWKDGYDSQGLYAGNFDDWFKQLTQFATQLGYNLFDEFANNFFGQNDQDDKTLFAIVDHTKIALDELHFVKELYTLSDKNIVNDARIILERDESITDYNQGTAKATAISLRKTFFPQFQFVKARGDVRMKLGQRFTITGPRVPGGTQELVCSEVKHIIDSDGYFMEIFGVRKFVL